MSGARQPWWLAIAAPLGTWFLRACAATWRYEVADGAEYTAALAAGERFVYAFWHSGILPLALLRRDEGIAVLVSQHRDGELIARLIRSLGYVVARGSSTRGGDAGVREMLAFAAEGRHLAVTPDGPRGPAERAKPGLVYLAARTGRRVVPIGMGTKPAWILKSWDRFRVPRPFARVCVTHGAPLTLEPASEAAPEQACAAIDSALVAVTQAMRERVGEHL